MRRLLPAVALLLASVSVAHAQDVSHTTQVLAPIELDEGGLLVVRVADAAALHRVRCQVRHGAYDARLVVAVDADGAVVWESEP